MQAQNLIHLQCSNRGSNTQPLSFETLNLLCLTTEPKVSNEHNWSVKFGHILELQHNPDPSGDDTPSTHCRINGITMPKLTANNYKLFRLQLSSYLGFRALDRWLRLPDDDNWDEPPDEPKYPSSHIKHLHTQSSTTTTTTTHSYNLRSGNSTAPAPATTEAAAPTAVDATHPTPVAPDYAERKYKALKEIQGTIRCLLSIKIVSLLGGDDVVSLLSPQRLLARLDYHFNPPSVQRQLVVEYELKEIKQLASENLLSYWARLYQKYQELLNCGGTMDDTRLVHGFMHNLHERWLFLKQQITVHFAQRYLTWSASIDFTYFLQELETTYAHLLTTDPPTALWTAPRGDPTPSTRPSHSNPLCYRCQTLGHVWTACKKEATYGWQFNPANPASKPNPNGGGRYRGGGGGSGGGAAKANLAQYTPGSIPVDWYVDSGASQSFIRSRHLFQDYIPFPTPRVVECGGENSNVLAYGSGTVHLALQDGSTLIICQCWWTPAIRVNLLSTSSLAIAPTSIDCLFTVDEDSRPICLLRSRITGHEITILRQHGLFPLPIKEPVSASALLAKSDPVAAEYRLLHNRLAHCGPRPIQALLRGRLAKGFGKFRHQKKMCKHKMAFCQTCALGKQTRAPHLPRPPRSHRPMDVIHSDVCGPIPTPTPEGYTYILTCIDDYSRFAKVYLISAKSPAPGKLEEFIRQARTFHGGRELKRLHCDSGGEYKSKALTSFLHSCGTEFTYTMVAEKEANGLAERFNRTLCTKARILLIHAGLPDSLLLYLLFCADLLSQNDGLIVYATSSFLVFSLGILIFIILSQVHTRYQYIHLIPK